MSCIGCAVKVHQRHSSSHYHLLPPTNHHPGNNTPTFKTYALAGARVLVDPWLVGDLSFFEQGWLYTGKKRGFGGGSGVQIDVREVAGDTDVVLITQVRLVSCVLRRSSRGCAVRLVLLKHAGLVSS
jgi:hypothetical protein